MVCCHLVETVQRLEVDMETSIAVEHRDGVGVAMLYGVEQAAAGAEGRQFASIADGKVAIAVAEILLNHLVHIAGGEHHVIVAVT